MTFIVALKLRSPEQLKRDLMEVSNPKSARYGKYLTREDISTKYGPLPSSKEKVIQHFEKIPGSAVIGRENLGDFISVTASIQSIEEFLQTKIGLVQHAHQLTNKKALRATGSFFVPEDVAHLISFISLNTPVTHVIPRAGKYMKEKEKERERTMESNGYSSQGSSSATVLVTSGNEEALIRFKPTCYGGVVNDASPPCSNKNASEVPAFVISVTEHANNISDPYYLSTDPQVFDIAPQNIYCYNTFTTTTCTGNGLDGMNCTCITKVR